LYSDCRAITEKQSNLEPRMNTNRHEWNEDEITSPFVFDFEFLILILIVWIAIKIKIKKWGQ